MDVKSEAVHAGSEAVNRRADGDENGDKIGLVEPSDVIDPEQVDIDQTPTPPPIPTSLKSAKIVMPERADLSQIALHSPSSEFVGTPFATNSTRFEYPFPDASHLSRPASPQSSPVISPSASTLLLPIAVAPPLASGNSFPILSTATLRTHPSSKTSSAAVSSMTLPNLGLTYSPLASSDMPSYNPAHPKLRTKNPPIPPSLAKKRTRWPSGLGLGSLNRRRSSSTTSGSPGSENAFIFSIEGPGHSSPLGSPQEEQITKR